MKRIIPFLLIALFAAAPAAAQEGPLTRAEKTDYAETSLYADITGFLGEVSRNSDFVRITSLCRSAEGRIVPLVILSREGISSRYELAMTGKDVVLIQANIHAGEIEGKEACLMLIREIGNGELASLLDNQVILVIPDLNADGNEKLSEESRRDNGPALAGERANGQNLDLNRDYLKLESPEINALVAIMNEWDPVLVVDMHTKNGSYHRAQVTYTTCLHPNSPRQIRDYMWKKLFPQVEKMMEKDSGYLAMPYGNFRDRLEPSKGWNNHAVEGRYGSNYVGLRNRFSILDENYPHVDFKTRVLSSYAFIRSILEYTGRNIGKMREIALAADRETKASFHRNELMLEYGIEKLFDLKVKSYRLVNEKIPEEALDQYPSWWNGVIVRNTGEPKDYEIEYFSKAVPSRSVPLPQGYVILPGNDNIVDNLIRHGLSVSTINNAVTAEVEQFSIESIEPSGEIFQGHAFINVSGKYAAATAAIPAGSSYISLEQPLARIAALLLEPESVDGFLRWGFLNRVAVRQWGRNRPGIYPVYRVEGLERKFDLTDLRRQ
ncbi:MAG: M14 family metallopeptidase [Candidatus Krumholzibacteriota bacterium]|nr:M14 family metallopeptidase [Candidatus Krumholzibacteriota bacterium]